MNNYYAGYDHTRQTTSTRVQSYKSPFGSLGQETLLLLNETQINILRFLFVISVLEKHHPTGSKICCCIPRFRTPVCVLSVLVKSAAELQQKSALLGTYSILRRGSLPRRRSHGACHAWEGTRDAWEGSAANTFLDSVLAQKVCQFVGLGTPYLNIDYAAKKDDI